MRSCSWCREDKQLEAFYACQNYVCKDCVKQRAKEWYSKNSARAQRNVASYSAANPERIKKYKQKWESKNRDRISVNGAKYRKAFPERRKASKESWRKRNMDRYASYYAQYRSAKLRATPSWANKFFMDEAYHLAQLRTKVTGFTWHVDHAVPLISEKVCGLHVEHNLRVIPGVLNMSKNNRSWEHKAGFDIAYLTPHQNKRSSNAVSKVPPTTRGEAVAAP